MSVTLSEWERMVARLMHGYGLVPSLDEIQSVAGPSFDYTITLIETLLLKKMQEKSQRSFPRD